MSPANELRPLTPSTVTAWLDCRHYLTLRSRVDHGLMPKPDAAFGSFASLLAEKGVQHELDCLTHYEQQDKTVVRIPGRRDGETFAAWVDRVGNPFVGNPDVVYQMPFICDGVRGIADFVVRVVDPQTGSVSYEPVDAKLARAEGKPGHVLQLCFYADAIETRAPNSSTSASRARASVAPR